MDGERERRLGLTLPGCFFSANPRIIAGLLGGWKAHGLVLCAEKCNVRGSAVLQFSQWFLQYKFMDHRWPFRGWKAHGLSSLCLKMECERKRSHALFLVASTY
eukprot:1159001-Pelagomonas_calceolata.AAC.10